MNNYYLIAIILKGCGYSDDAVSLIKNYNIPAKIVNITYAEKDKFKSDKISTFPQIYLARNDAKGTLLIGGYHDLYDVVTTFYKKKVNNNIDIFMKKYNWSRKGTLRLIELINS
jgi:glutaredoxin-related protein